MNQSVKPISLSGELPTEAFNTRLDQCLAQLFPDYSRSKLKEWIVNDCVSVDGEVSNIPRLKMKGGERIVIEAEQSVQTHDLPESIQLNIVYEDEDILIINKPADLVVHPGAGNQSGTLLNALLAHCPGIEHVPRAGIVHRLDKETTGLMVVAKNLTAQTHLVNQLQAREMGREYEAVVMGRTHQIRVHMSHIKHPLVGDIQYGGRARLPKHASDELVDCLRYFQRQALHAIQLSLQHPSTGELMTWKCPLPDDFSQLLSQLDKDADINGFNQQL